MSTRVNYGSLSCSRKLKTQDFLNSSSSYISKMVSEFQWLEDFLKKDNADKTLERLSKCASEPAVGVGENFASSISRVKLEGFRADGKRTKISLILKKLPSKAAQIRFLESQQFFKTELRMYKEILPMFEDVLQEIGVPTLWPDFLGERGQYLIFSDLKIKNYKTNCRFERLDMEHALIAIKTIALFHAASVVLEERGQLEVSGLPHTFLVRDTKETRKYVTGGMRIGGEAILSEWGSEWADIGRRLIKKSSNWTKEMDELYKLENSKLNVLNHGDIWTTNLLFKYSKSVDVPIGIKFVDFQLSHYNSYAYDVIYLLYTSLQPQLRRNRSRELLKAYADLLKETLRLYGLEKRAPTLAEVEEEIRRLSLYILMVAFAILPIVISKEEMCVSVDLTCKNRYPDFVIRSC